MEQDRKCMYNVTIRHIRATSVVVEYYTTYVSICSLRYPECNAPLSSVACPDLQHFSTLYFTEYQQIK